MNSLDRIPPTEPTEPKVRIIDNPAQPRQRALRTRPVPGCVPLDDVINCYAETGWSIALLAPDGRIIDPGMEAGEYPGAVMDNDNMYLPGHPYDGYRIEAHAGSLDDRYRLQEGL
jgi:hypothetical protein